MRYKTKVLLSYLMTLTLILGCILVPNTAKADTNLQAETSEMTVWKTYTGTVDGIERTLIAVILEDGTTSEYIKIGDAESNLLWYNNVDVGIDQYGAVWILEPDHLILWWSYDLEPTFEDVFSAMGFYWLPKTDSTDPLDYKVNDVESLIFEGTGEQAIVTGYKTFSGEICPLPSFDEMKKIAEIEEPIPEPLYIPKGMESLITPRPSTPTPVSPTPTPSTSVSSTPSSTPSTSASSAPSPTISASVSSAPIPTPDTPTSVVPLPGADTPVPATGTPAPKVDSKKLSIETEKKAKVLYEGDDFIGQYTLKKAVLTWKGPKKKGRAKGVKYVGFIKKSKNLVYITKKGAAYTVSFKTGKKKLIVKPKQKAKKFIYSGKFVTKIKTASGKVNVSNK